MINARPIVYRVGLAGETNVQGEEQKKLDVLSDDIMVNALRACGKTSVLVSEEREEAVIIEDRLKVRIYLGSTLCLGITGIALG